MTKDWTLKEVVCDVPFQLYLVVDHRICNEMRHKISKLLLLLSYRRCYYCASEVMTIWHYINLIIIIIIVIIIIIIDYYNYYRTFSLIV